MNAIIIDDEPKAIKMLKMLLQEYCPEITVVAEANDVPTAVKLIHKHNPEIVFSDIEMPEYDGFHLFKFVDNAQFEIIFCTAHNEYALRAFEVSAVDYLLKPIQGEKLRKAVDKAKMLIQNSKNTLERYTTLQMNINSNELKRIALPVADGLLFVDLQNIMYLEADASYTKVFMTDGNILISKKIKDFENILTLKESFYRIHRSFIVNLLFINQYIKTSGGFVILKNNVQIPVARERKEEFQEIIHNIKL